LIFTGIPPISFTILQLFCFFIEGTRGASGLGNLIFLFLGPLTLVCFFWRNFLLLNGLCVFFVIERMQHLSEAQRRKYLEEAEKNKSLDGYVMRKLTRKEPATKSDTGAAKSDTGGEMETRQK